MLVQCKLERDSVASGDDCNAPHRLTISIDVPDAERNPALLCIRHVAKHVHYLPSVAGGSTWIAYADEAPVAVVTLFGYPEIYSLGDGDGQLRNSISIRFAYYLANDPQRIIRQLLAGQEADRIHGHPPIA